MVCYLDTSAFLTLLTVEDESAALRSWFSTHESMWSSQLLRAEAMRAATRLGIEPRFIDDARETISLVLPSATTFFVAGRLTSPSLRTLDALHLATAMEIGEELSGFVVYDHRLSDAARAASLPVLAPR